MQKTDIAALFAHSDLWIGRDVTVGGWVRTLRLSKSIGFIELNDGSCQRSLQVVIEQAMPDFALAATQNVGAALVITGTLVASPNDKQPLELHAIHLEVEGISAPEYPLQKKRHSMEYLRTIAHLRPRTNTFGAIFRIRSACAFAIHEFFNQRGFFYIHTPLITASDCEGAGDMFQVTTLDPAEPPRTEDGTVDYSKDFFGKRTALTVSGQLSAECMALALGKVYTFGPTFRAERSNTPRHAAEFWMIEPEIAFADLADDMALAGDMLQYVVRYLLEHCAEDLQFFNRFFDDTLLERLTKLAKATFSHVTYTDAIELLTPHQEQFAYPVFWGCDLQTEHERFLTEQVFHGPVFVTDYPKEIKAFYMRLNDDRRTVAAMDLLVPGVGELIGGSQREEREDVLRARLAELGMDESGYDWYLDLRRFGGTRHAGFGLGFERLVMYVTGVSNIRDVLPFPRTTGAAEY